MLSAQYLEIDQRARACAKRFKEAHADLLGVIMEVDATKLYAILNFSSTYDYCRKHLRLSENIACSFIVVARKARSVPELKTALEQGLDFSKVKLAARVITPENQREILGMAEVCSCAELERFIVREYPRAAVVEKVSPVAANRNKLELGLSDEVLEMFRRAQDLVCNKEKRAANLEDTLAAVLENYLKREDPLRKAERAKPGETVPEEAAAAPADAGHRIPAASVHAVNLRDRCRCQIPGCGRTRWVDIHHRKPRAEGGSHDPDNLITLCKFHHQQHHRRERAKFYRSRERYGRGWGAGGF